ncbi:hypothetical protein [uncultured Brevibacillus sp.]|uniref:hypothetical protein n=1 Tax=uncultured Brevibacillus sp. TaxID=169970 RepID=UPI002595F169|nr:hypothetical protein [uncultured Brevibacillus sp.]
MKKTEILLSAVLVLASGITACSNGSNSNSTQQERSQAGMNTLISSYANVVDDIKQKSEVPAFLPSLLKPLGKYFYGIQYEASKNDYSLTVYATDKELEVNSPELTKPGSQQIGSISGSKSNKPLNSFEEAGMPENPKAITIDSTVTVSVDSESDIFGYMEFENWKVKIIAEDDSATKKLAEIYDVLKNRPLQDFSRGRMLLTNRYTFINWKSEDDHYEYFLQWGGNSLSHVFEIVESK